MAAMLLISCGRLGREKHRGRGPVLRDHTLRVANAGGTAAARRAGP